MYLTPDTLRRLAATYGEPLQIDFASEFNVAEFELLRGCLRKRRAHDVTLFISGGERFALIRKPSYPRGLFRPPSGGVEPDEAFEEGAEREAREETGLRVRLTRYLLAVRSRISHNGETVEWATHVFAADALSEQLCVQDCREVAEACWATPEAIDAVMRPRMLAWGTPGMRYRVMLQDHALRLLGY